MNLFLPLKIISLLPTVKFIKNEKICKISLQIKNKFIYNFLVKIIFI